jgi:hypothetical protein
VEHAAVRLPGWRGQDPDEVNALEETEVEEADGKSSDRSEMQEEWPAVRIASTVKISLSTE